VVTQDVIGVPLQRYRLQGWINLAELQTGSCQVEMVPLNRYGGAVGAPTTITYSQPTPAWQPFSLDSTLPSNATKLRVQFKSNNLRGTAHLDALALLPAP